MSPTTQQVRTQGYVVVACEIPSELTIAEYRAARAERAPRRKWHLVPVGRRRR